MVKIPYIAQRVEIEEGVQVSVEGSVVGVEGPRGALRRDFSHAGGISINKKGNCVLLEAYFAREKERSTINTIASHVKNMMIGVLRGFRYKMAVVYAHYPVSVSVHGDRVVIENFLGEKSKRYAKIVDGVKVIVSGEDVVVEGIDLEGVGQTAANIHQATHLSGKKRLSPHGRGGGPGILDGIYLYVKENMD